MLFCCNQSFICDQIISPSMVLHIKASHRWNVCIWMVEWWIMDDCSTASLYHVIFMLHLIVRPYESGKEFFVHTVTSSVFTYFVICLATKWPHINQCIKYWNHTISSSNGKLTLFHLTRNQMINVAIHHYFPHFGRSSDVFSLGHLNACQYCRATQSYSSI